MSLPEPAASETLDLTDLVDPIQDIMSEVIDSSELSDTMTDTVVDQQQVLPTILWTKMSN